MILFIKKLFAKKVVVPAVEPEEKVTLDIDDFRTKRTRDEILSDAYQKNVQVDVPRAIAPNGATMDSVSVPAYPNYGPCYGVPDNLVEWYGNQGFIGYVMCAFIAQNWLVDKICTMPAQDAFRKGYELTINSGEEINIEIQNEIRNVYDKKFEINQNLIEFVKMGRVFGIRIALFLVVSKDPKYYEKPFNIHGVLPGTYKGISQIDPYWITPQLGDLASSDPTSKHFYEPTWWNVQGRRIHRTHLVIMRNGEVADILKPTYFFGGISVPQKLYERVYCSERMASEIPALAVTKRTKIFATDISKFPADPGKISRKLERINALQNNFGTILIDKEGDSVTQLDTNLTDIDAATTVQYQLASAIGELPIVKLLGTSPKGLNGSGQYEEASYHETLESIQTTYGTPLLDRHYLLTIKSYIAPKYGIDPFEVEIKWNALDAMTSEEEMLVNKGKAETAKLLVEIGAIDGTEERDRLTKDLTSGYNGLELLADEDPIDQVEYQL